MAPGPARHQAPVHRFCIQPRPVASVLRLPHTPDAWERESAWWCADRETHSQTGCSVILALPPTCSDWTSELSCLRLSLRIWELAMLMPP